MNSFMNNYFGPLPKEYCVYFLTLSVIFAIIFMFSLISALYFGLTHFRKLNAMFVANSALVLLNLFLGYFINRLLYTVCVKSYN